MSIVTDIDITTTLTSSLGLLASSTAIVNGIHNSNPISIAAGFLTSLLFVWIMKRVNERKNIMGHDKDD